VRRLGRILKWFAALLVLGLCLLVSGVLLLVNTETGSRRLVQFALGNSGLDIRVDRINGTLLSGLGLQGLQLNLPDASLTVPLLEFVWQPLLLPQGTLRIDLLRVQGLRWLSQSQADPAPSEPLQHDDLAAWFELVPFAVELRELDVSDLAVQIDAVEFSLQGLQAGLVLQQSSLTLDVSALELYDASVQGRLALTSNLDLEGQIAWQYPPAGDYAGILTLDGSLQALQISHLLQAPFDVQSSGSITTGLFDGSLPALALQHQLAQLDGSLFDQPDIFISAANLATTGTAERLELAGNLQLQVQEFAPATLSFDMVYQPEQLQLTAITLDSEDLGAAVSGNFDIESNTLALQWQLLHLSLERIANQVPLDALAGSGNLQLAIKDSGLFDAGLQIGPLQGTLDGHPLSLAGSLQMLDSALQSLDLRLDNGQNQLLLSGTLEPELDLTWTLAAPELDAFWQGLAGSLQGNGQVQGSVDAPRLEGSLAGRDFSLSLEGQHFSLANFDLLATAQEEHNDLQLRIGSIMVDADGESRQWLESALVVLDGTLQQHTMSLQAQGWDSDLYLLLAGAQLEDGWRGNLQDANLRSPYGDLRLLEPASLQFAAGLLDVGRHCWLSGAMELCLEASQDALAGLDAELAFSGLPLHWFNDGVATADKPAGLHELQRDFALFMPEGMEISGTVDLAAHINGFSDGTWRELRAEVLPRELSLMVLRDGLLEPLLAEDAEAVEDGSGNQHFSFSDLTLLLASDGENWQATLGFQVSQLIDASAARSGSALLQGVFNANLAMDAQSRLQGEMHLDFPELAWLETLVPDLREINGQLFGTVAIAGTREAPEFDALVNIAGAGFKVPEYGLDITGLTLNLQSTPDLVNLSLRANSGTGYLIVDGAVNDPMLHARTLTLGISGERFTVMNTLAARLELSPDLQITWMQDALDVRGRVLAPTASVDLESFVASASTGAVSTSRDVVVSVPDDAALVGSSGQILPLHMGLQLALGDAVYLTGFGLDARLAGAMELQQEPNRPLLAYGELSIPTGSYRIYNQQLETRDGRLLFFGNPLNPVLDLRAFRETTRAEVGVLLRGSVNSIQGTLYSTPTLPENEILSLLVTGKSFNNMDDQDGTALVSAIANFGLERGEGFTSRISDQLGLDDLSVSGGDSYLDSSVGVGKYITPDLLMRYEIGLFGRQAVLSIDYSLTERIKLEVRSGLSQSVDISYTIEKN
jgi:translocation and assembly module TamB